MEKEVRQYDLSCRNCGVGFDFEEINTTLVSIVCGHCGDDLQFFNGVVIQDNGENYFDIYGEIADCSTCGKEPSIEFIEQNGNHHFSFSCGHEETSSDGKDEILAGDADLDAARGEWNEINSTNKEVNL